MKRPLLVGLLFLLLCLAQWAVPAMMIQAGEKTLEQGTAWRFRTAPVDPYDPFVGRFVRLSYALERQPLVSAQGPEWQQGQKLYAHLAEDAQGFAEFSELSSEPPADGDYIAVSIRYKTRDEVWLHLPFDRFYMEEHQAPQAELAYAEMQRESREAWTVVRVRDGHAVLEELYLDGLPVREYLDSMGTGPR